VATTLSLFDASGIDRPGLLLRRMLVFRRAPKRCPVVDGTAGTADPYIR